MNELIGNYIEIIGNVPNDTLLIEELKMAVMSSLERGSAERKRNPIFVVKQSWISADGKEKGDTPSDIRTMPIYSIGCKMEVVR